MLPLGDQRRLRLNRNAAHAARELARDAGDRGFDFEQILHRLEEQQIDAALDERARLLAVDRGEFLEGDLRERGIRRRDQHSGRAQRAGDETRAIGRRVRIGGFARDARGR